MEQELRKRVLFELSQSSRVCRDKLVQWRQATGYYQLDAMTWSTSLWDFLWTKEVSPPLRRKSEAAASHRTNYVRIVWDVVFPPELMGMGFEGISWLMTKVKYSLTTWLNCKCLIAYHWFLVNSVGRCMLLHTSGNSIRWPTIYTSTHEIIVQLELSPSPRLCGPTIFTIISVV